jgi:hypothetical protein
MTSSANSPLRQLFESRISQFSSELEALFSQARERARSDLAGQLNQAVRLLRQAPDRSALAAALTGAAAAFSNGAALFRIEGGEARAESVRGLPLEDFVSLVVPLESAAALRGAVESRDPVTAIANEAEISPQLLSIFGLEPDGRVIIYPLASGDRVHALLCTWGSVHSVPIELLTQVAADVWQSLEPLPPPAPPELVQLALPVPAPAPAPAPTWESLPHSDQQIHLRAQRFARVQAAEMRLREADAVQSGRTARDLYTALHASIDSARDAFRRDFFETCPSMVDYLHLELVRTLAHDDSELLGKSYPGPLV